MKMKNWFSAAVVLGVSMLLPLSANAVDVRENAPDFTLKSLEGSNLRLSRRLVSSRSAHWALASQRHVGVGIGHWIR